jgi:hypothetical protein
MSYWGKASIADANADQMPIMYGMANLQRPKHSAVSLSSVHLQNINSFMHIMAALLHILKWLHFYILFYLHYNP